MMSKIIPKSVLKIGVKLPDARKDSGSTANHGLDYTESQETSNVDMIDSVLGKFSLSENPFIKHDKKLFGKTLFRTKFTRFGHAQKQQWQQPAPQFDNPIDEVSFTQRERVRRELAAILKGARSALDLNTEDLDKVTLTPKMLLEGQNMSAEDIKTWPSAPDLFHDSRENDDESEISRLMEITSNSHCVKCRSPVYPLEKIEPMSGQLYHPQCFKCVECHTQLSLATFCRSLHSNRDLQVYCRAHQPRQDKVMLCKFNARKSSFPAFKLSWQGQSTNNIQSPFTKTSYNLT